MKLKIATVVMAMMLVASSSFAAGMQWIGVGGGGSIPSGDLSDFAKTGFYAGGVYGYGLSKNLALGAMFAYHGFGAKDSAGVKGPKLKAYQYTAQLFYSMPSKDMKMMPYITVGPGAYTLTSDASGATSKTKFGVNGGVGVNYAVNKQTSLGLDAMYHYVSTGSDFKKADGSNATFSIITVGVHVGWMLGGGGSSGGM